MDGVLGVFCVVEHVERRGIQQCRVPPVRFIERPALMCRESGGKRLVIDGYYHRLGCSTRVQRAAWMCAHDCGRHTLETLGPGIPDERATVILNEEADMLIGDTLDAIAIVAEHKLQTAIEDGLFDRLPVCGRIECTTHGERFFVRWWRDKIAREELLVQVT